MRTQLRLPVVNEVVRNVGRLVRIEDVTPAEPIVDHIFEVTKFQIITRVNGKQLQILYTDPPPVIGPMSNRCDECLPCMIDHARELIARFGRCDIEHVIIKVTSQYRARPVDRAHAYDKQLRAFVPLKFGHTRDLPLPVIEEVWNNVGPARWIQALRNGCGDGRGEWPPYWCSRCGRCICSRPANEPPDKPCTCESVSAETREPIGSDLGSQF